MSFSRNKILVNCIEDDNGRAFHTLAAIRWCASALKSSGYEVCAVGVDEPRVEAALQSLRFETGLSLTNVPDKPSNLPDSQFQSARMYVACVFESTEHLDLERAERLGAEPVVAVQFPTNWTLSARYVHALRAAHDPRRLAALICAPLDLPRP